jgi:DNA invertase Pin-like site-specific DNA recombinase
MATHSTPHFHNQPGVPRELIRARTGEGRARAVANGVRLGRKPTLTDHQQLEAVKRLKAGKETLGEIARSYNVSRWTISRLSELRAPHG